MMLLSSSHLGLQESGYLGEIRFESRNGVKREFHMFADREIGIK